jgi:hypothetical protein
MLEEGTVKWGAKFLARAVIFSSIGVVFALGGVALYIGEFVVEKSIDSIDKSIAVTNTRLTDLRQDFARENDNFRKHIEALMAANATNINQHVTAQISDLRNSLDNHFKQTDKRLTDIETGIKKPSSIELEVKPIPFFEIYSPAPREYDDRLAGTDGVMIGPVGSTGVMSDTSSVAMLQTYVFTGSVAVAGLWVPPMVSYISSWGFNDANVAYATVSPNLGLNLQSWSYSSNSMLSYGIMGDLQPIRLSSQCSSLNVNSFCPISLGISGALPRGIPLMAVHGSKRRMQF